MSTWVSIPQQPLATTLRTLRLSLFQRPRPMPAVSKRKSYRCLLGHELMKHVPSFNLECGDVVSVTAARRYVAEHKIKAPALLLVRRTPHTVDRFYWSRKGMYGALYAEHNYFNFSCLRDLHSQLCEENIIRPEFAAALLAADIEVENYRYEFAYI